jgi:hypothetical protein
MRKFDGFVRVSFNVTKGAVVLYKGEADKHYAADEPGEILAAVRRAMDAEKAGLDRWSCWLAGVDRKKPETAVTAAEIKAATAVAGAGIVMMANKYGQPVLAVLPPADKAKTRRSVLRDY